MVASREGRRGERERERVCMWRRAATKEGKGGVCTAKIEQARNGWVWLLKKKKKKKQEVDGEVFMGGEKKITIVILVVIAIIGILQGTNTTYATTPMAARDEQRSTDWTAKLAKERIHQWIEMEVGVFYSSCDPAVSAADQGEQKPSLRKEIPHINKGKRAHAKIAKERCRKKTPRFCRWVDGDEKKRRTHHLQKNARMLCTTSPTAD